MGPKTANTCFFQGGLDSDGRPLSIEARDGLFAAMGPDIKPAPDSRVVDLQGRTVLPGFVDGHIHLDKGFVGDRWHPHRPVSTLRERLAVEKTELAEAACIETRANALLQQATAFGTVAMRSHVDVDATVGLEHLHAVMAVRDAWKGVVDIQLVAFPQAGVMSCPGSAAQLEAALAEGVEVLGGLDPTTLDEDADGQLDVLFEMAGRYGTDIDIHLHEPGRTGIDQLQRIAKRTLATGLVGKVSVSHAYCLGDVDVGLLSDTFEILQRADIAIMTTAPGNRAFPPVAELHDAGVRVFAGNDNIQDAWSPYGNGDPLLRAMLVGYRSDFNVDEDLWLALEMVTTAPAAVMALEDYGLAVGKRADFVAVSAHNHAHAVSSVPYDRLVVRSGEPQQ